MPRRDEAEKEFQDFTLTFGAGVSMSSSPDAINPEECVDGSNFDLSSDQTSLRPRWPALSFAPVPANGIISGFAQYLEYEQGGEKNQAKIHTIVFTTDGRVYKIRVAPERDNTSGAEAFESGGDAIKQGRVEMVPNVFDATSPVAANSSSIANDLPGDAPILDPPSYRLRGFADQHSFELSRTVIITDLELQIPVLLWKPLDNTIEKLVSTGPDFYAKNCAVYIDRAWFSDIRSGGAYTPHMVVASEVEDETNISVANKPSSAIGAGDPFFFLTPDFSAATALVPALGEFMVITSGDSVFRLGGNSSQDFFLDPLYSGRAGAVSDHPATFAENDVMFANREGIQTLAGTQAFGDIENDDISRQVRAVFDTEARDFRPRYSLHDYGGGFNSDNGSGRPAQADPYSEIDAVALIEPDLTALTSLFYNGSDNALVAQKTAGRFADNPTMSEVWFFFKTFLNQLARDVSALRSANVLSGWVRMTSRLSPDRRSVDVSNPPFSGHVANGFGQSLEPFVFPLYLPSEDEGRNDEFVSFYKSFMYSVGRYPGGLVEEVQYAFHPWKTNKQQQNSTPAQISRAGDIRLTTATSQNYFSIPESFAIPTYRLSRLIKAPSGENISQMTGLLHYKPRSYDDIEVVLTFVYSGVRTIIKRTVVTLEGFSAQANDNLVSMPYQPLSVEFSVPHALGKQLQIGVTVDTKYDFEILSIDFNVKA